MKINKKAFLGLLGGGGVCLLSFGGLKIGEKIRGDKKVKHFRFLKSKFRDLLNKEATGLKDFTIPNYEDSFIGKKHGDAKEENRVIGEGVSFSPRITLKSFEELRDICYKFLTEEIEKNSQRCIPGSGGCDTCLLQKGWYGTSIDY